MRRYVAFALVLLAAALAEGAGDPATPPAEAQLRTAERPAATKPVTMEFVRVPAGAFRVYDQNGQAMKKKDVSAFWMGKQEVPNGAYGLFLKNFQWEAALTHPKQPKDLKHDPTSDMADANGAVRGVGWFSAYAFAKWCGAAMPTQEQWLKAAFWDPEQPSYDPNYGAGNMRFIQIRADEMMAVPVRSSGGDVSYYGMCGITSRPAEWVADQDADDNQFAAMGYYNHGRPRVIAGGGASSDCGIRVVLNKLDLAGMLSDAQRKQYLGLVQQLGGAKFQDREQAQKLLGEAGVMARPVLIEYADCDDPEIRLRVRKALNTRASLRLRLTVEKRKDGTTRGKLIPVLDAGDKPAEEKEE